MTRSRAIAVVALPIAVLMAAAAARVEGQEPLNQPMAQPLRASNLTSLDKSANPCDDFYQFACGGWIKNHPAPPDQPRYQAVSTKLQDRNNAILRDILDEASKPTAAPELKKVGDYYASCMGRNPRSTARGKAPLTPDLAACRRDQGQGRESPPSSATCTPSACREILRVRRGARLQGRDAVHADPSARAGWGCPIATITSKTTPMPRSCAPSTSKHVKPDAASLAGTRRPPRRRGPREGPGDRNHPCEKCARSRQPAQPDQHLSQDVA